MVKNPDIETILRQIKRNPADTTEFLLGTICSDMKSQREDLSTIKERQVNIDRKIDISNTALEEKIASIQLEVEAIKRKNAFNKGFVTAITAMGGAVGGSIVAAWKYIIAAAH